MRALWRKPLVATGVVALIVAASSCDLGWNDMTPWSYGPPCNHPTYYVIHMGDFSSGEIADIHEAVEMVAGWSGIDIRFRGMVNWRSGGPEQPTDTVSIERRNIIPELPTVNYGWPNPVNGVYTRGRLFIGTGTHYPARVPSGFGTGPTFYGIMLHEAAHAFVGVGDMYHHGDGHPGLMMGKGYLTMSAFAAGDLIGLVEKGCRSPQNKAELTHWLRTTYR